MSLTLTSLPEEILERILAFALEPSTPPSDVPPATLKTGFTRSQSTPFPASAARGAPSTNSRPADFRSFSRPPVYRYTPLLSCTLFARIGTPLLYSFVHLKSRARCTQLACTLRARPALARCVRALRADALWGECEALLRALHVPGGRLEQFDFCIADERDGSSASTPALAQACGALRLLPQLGTVRRLTLRKAADAYLTLPAPNAVLACLGAVIPEWHTLDTVHVLFRLPSSPRTGTPAGSDTSGAQALVAALARAPALRVLHAELPAVWNPALLAIAANPALHAICLRPAPPLAGAHVFLAHARRHARLAALIERGTPVCAPAPVACGAVLHPHGRVRANTTAGACPTPGPAPSTRSSVAFPSAPPPATPVPAPAGTSTGPGQRPAQRRTGRRQSKASRRMSAV